VWPDALNEALLACERLSEPPGQPAFGAALYQLAELHRLRGDVQKAEEAYLKAAESGRSPYPGLALLRLAEGRREDASAAICRVLKEVPHRRGRSKMLAAAVEIMLAGGDVGAAREAADELGALADVLKTPFMRALASEARGAVSFADGDAAAALSASRAAWTLWRELEVPYGAARTQITIANACRALGDRDSADLELSAARRTFEQLGAKLDTARLAPAEPKSHRSAGLTDRELQVLQLVATGRSNRAIAADLGLSEKTVARHISNIFNKLDVSSRAAATAYAFEHRLTQRST